MDNPKDYEDYLELPTGDEGLDFKVAGIAVLGSLAFTGFCAGLFMLAVNYCGG